MESKQTLIFRLYQVLNEYSDADHPLTQQKIIDILSDEYDLVVERKAIGRNVSYLKEMGFEIEGDKKGIYLASRPFENSELRLLIDSVLSSSHINAAYSKQLIDKLILLGGKYFKAHVSTFTRCATGIKPKITIYSLTSTSSTRQSKTKSNSPSTTTKWARTKNCTAPLNTKSALIRCCCTISTTTLWRTTKSNATSLFIAWTKSRKCKFPTPRAHR